MNRDRRTPGLDVRLLRDYWWVFWYRQCGWGVGAMSQRFAPHPFDTIARALEQAAWPCACPACKPVATIAERIPG